MTMNFLPRPRASVLERDHRKNFEHELNGCALIQVNGGWLDLNQNGRVRGVLVFKLLRLAATPSPDTPGAQPWKRK